MNPHRRFVLLIALGACGAAGAVPFAVEGTLSRFDASGLTCNGVNVAINAATTYSTPSGTASFAQIADTRRFPGHPLWTDETKSAFLGGTCIVSGDDPGAAPVAQTVFVELRENVLVGPTTSRLNAAPLDPSQRTPFAIMGVEVVLLVPKPADKETPDYGTAFELGGRILAGPVLNSFGYEVDLATVPVGDESSAEGYMGADGRFYAHVVETTGGLPKADGGERPPPDARIVRGQVGFVNNTTVKLEIRGTCRWFEPPTGAAARTQPVLVVVDRGTSGGNPIWVNPSAPQATLSDSMSNVNCVEDPAAVGFGEFRFRLDRYSAGGTSVPTQTKARVATPANSTVPAYPWSPEFVLDRAGFR